MLKVLRRAWVPLLIVVVVLLGLFMVDRLRGVFGKTELTRPGAGLVNDPEPFDPKVVKYEIFGSGTMRRPSTTSIWTLNRRRRRRRRCRGR